MDGILGEEDYEYSDEEEEGEEQEDQNMSQTSNARRRSMQRRLRQAHEAPRNDPNATVANTAEKQFFPESDAFTPHINRMPPPHEQHQYYM